MTDINVHKKLIRIYIDASLSNGASVALTTAQAHYFHNVMRKTTGDAIRVFNGRDGEWLCLIDTLSKKNGQILPQEQLKPQTGTGTQTGGPAAPAQHITLIFAPIKKQRLDFLIEKAVELGVTCLQPVLTQNTEMRKINAERIESQIIEAAEQCERLDIPTLLPLIALEKAAPLHEVIYAAIERLDDVPHIAEVTDTQNCALLIGPEGGFTAEEVQWLSARSNVTAVGLGPQIMRAETAALFGLAHLGHKTLPLK
jgi:16S rRNA (uracil1498-N3)-methyltransferase